MTEWAIVPDESTVWIEGSSTLHPIRAAATGLTGSLDCTMSGAGLASGTPVSGSVEIAINALASGNRLVDAETRRRVDAKRHPKITGEILSGHAKSAAEIALEGVIEFRGERVIVEGSLDVVEASDRRLVVEGAAIFDVRWWGLEPPRLAVLRVDHDIEVTVQIMLEPAG